MFDTPETKIARALEKLQREHRETEMERQRLYDRVKELEAFVRDVSEHYSGRCSAPRVCGYAWVCHSCRALALLPVEPEPCWVLGMDDKTRCSLSGPHTEHRFGEPEGGEGEA